MSVQLNGEGDPYIDGRGKINIITGATNFRQKIINIFNTHKSSEPLLPYYGFDFYNFFNQEVDTTPETKLYRYTVEALRPENLFGQFTVSNIDVYVSGSSGFIGFDVTDTDENTYPLAVGIGENN